MEIISKGLGMNRLKFNVQFSNKELEKYYDYGHEAKCYLMFNIPVEDEETELDIEDFKYLESEHETFTKELKTEIISSYRKKGDDNIFLELKFSFVFEKNIEVEYAEVIYKGNRPIMEIFSSSTIPYYQNQIKLVLDKIFERKNQGDICNICPNKFKQKISRQCHRMYFLGQLI